MNKVIAGMSNLTIFRGHVDVGSNLNLAGDMLCQGSGTFTSNISITHGGLSIGSPQHADASQYALDVEGDIRASGKLIAHDIELSNAYYDRILTDKVTSENIGVRTQNPQYPLDVHGDIRSTSNVYAHAFIFPDGTTLSPTQLAADFFPTLHYDDTQTFLGIRQKTPAYTLDVDGDIRSTQNAFIQNDVHVQGLLRFPEGRVFDWTDPTNIADFHKDRENQRFGIFAPHPAYTLDVRGDAGISRDLTVSSNVTASSFTGNGAGITDLDASHINAGTLDTRFGGTGRTHMIPRQVLLGNGSNALQTTALLVCDPEAPGVGVNKSSNIRDTLDVNGSLRVSDTAFFDADVYAKKDIVLADGTRLGSKRNLNFKELYQYDSNIGIGASDPHYKLDVAGDMHVRDKAVFDRDVRVHGTIRGNGAGLCNLQADMITGVLPVGKGGTGITQIAPGHLLGGDTSSVRAFPFLRAQDDRLGIGTCNPAYTLDVHGDVHIGDRLRVEGTLEGDGSRLSNLDANAIAQGVLTVSRGGIGLSEVPAGRFLVGDATSNIMRVVPDMYYDASRERLGVFTTEPVSNVDIARAVHIRSNLTLEQGLYANHAIRGRLHAQDVQDGVLPVTHGGTGWNPATQSDRGIFFYDGHNQAFSNTASIRVASSALHVDGGVETHTISVRDSLSFSDDIMLTPSRIERLSGLYRDDSRVKINGDEADAQLDVRGTVQIHGDIYGDGSHLSNIRISHLSNDTVLSTRQGGTGTSNFPLHHIVVGGGEASPLQFVPGTVIDDQGRFGIATSNPRASLDVNGPAHFSASVTIDGDIDVKGSFQISASNITDINVDNVSQGTLALAYGGLGTSNLAPNKLLVAGACNVESAALLHYCPHATCLGIGTENPRGTLDVNGDVYVDRGIYLADGSVLNSRQQLRPPALWVDESNHAYHGVGLSNPTVAWDVAGVVRAHQGFRGDGSLLSNLDARHIARGELPLQRGGTGSCNDYIPDRLLTVRSNRFQSVPTVSLRSNDSMLQVDGSIFLEQDCVVQGHIRGKGSEIRDLDANHITTGVLSAAQGGTGRASFPAFQLVAGDESGGLRPMSNMRYDAAQQRWGIDLDESEVPERTLDVNGDMRVRDEAEFEDRAIFRGPLILSDGSALSNTRQLRPVNLYENASNIGINVPEPAHTLEVGGDCVVHGGISGDGSNLSNLDATQISHGVLSVSRGGTGRSEFSENGMILGGGAAGRPLKTTSNVYFDTSNARLGVLTQSPQTELHVEGGVYIKDELSVDHRIRLADGSYISDETQLRPRGVYQNAADCNIGIRTQQPQYALDIDGDLRVREAAHFESGVHAPSFSGDGSNLENLDMNRASLGFLRVNHGGTGTRQFMRHKLIVGNDTDELYSANLVHYDFIRQRLGINTESPAYTTEIDGTLGVQGETEMHGALTLFDRLLLKDGTRVTGRSDLLLPDWRLDPNEGYYGIALSEDETPLAKLDINGSLRVRDDAVFRQQVRVDASLVLSDGFRLDGSNDIRVPNVYPLNENIGIGETNPQNKLEVGGTVLARDDVRALGHFIGDGSRLANIDMESASLQGILAVAHGGTGRSTLPRDELLIGDGDRGIYADAGLRFDRTNKRLGIGSADAPAYTLDVDGGLQATQNSVFRDRVGIQTADPAYALDVQGEARAQSFWVDDRLWINPNNIQEDRDNNAWAFRVGGDARVQDLLRVDQRLAVGYAQDVALPPNSDTYALDVRGFARMRDVMRCDDKIGVHLGEGASPAYEADINGTARVSEDVIVEQLLFLGYDASFLPSVQDGTKAYIHGSLYTDSNSLVQGRMAVGVDPTFADASFDLDVRGSCRVTENAYFENRMGIQTQQPEHTLDVHGDAHVTGVILAENGLEANNGIILSDGTALFDKDDLLSTAFTQNTEKYIGIHETDPQYRLDVNGDVRTQGNALIDGDLGLGTRTPAYRLDVRGQTRVTDNIVAQSNLIVGNKLVLADGTEILERNDLRPTEITQTPEGRLGFRETDPQFSIDIKGVMRAQDDVYMNRNVGVRTENPLYPLDVRGQMRITEAIFADQDVDVGGKIILSDGTEVREKNDLLPTSITQRQDTTNTFVGLHETFPEFRLDVNGDTRFQQDVYMIRDVGIGTTAPEFKLDVQGDMRVRNKLHAEDDVDLGGTLILSDGTQLKTRDDLLASGFTQSKFGSVGINEENPQYILDVNGTCRIKQDLFVEGDVGLGTKNPEYRLDIRGDMRATENVLFESNISIGRNGRLVLSDGTVIENKDDLISSAFTQNQENGYVGVHTTTDDPPAYPFDVNGTIRGRDDAYFAGRVGIGNTSPEYTLDVSGDIRTTSALVLSDGTPVTGKDDLMPPSITSVSLDDNEGGLIGINKSTPAHALDVSGGVRTTGTVLFESNLIVGGVSDETPQHTLDVRGDARISETLYVDNDIDVTSGGALILSDGTRVEGRADLVPTSLTQNAQGQIGVRRESPEYTLDVGGSTRIHGNALMDSNVGVKTLLPEYDVDVRGSVRATDKMIAGGGLDLHGALVLPDDTVIDGKNDLLPSSLTQSESEGYIGVLETDPAYTLDINGVLRVQSNAVVDKKMGVGTQLPAYALDVRGQMRATEAIYAEADVDVSGSVILSDGTVLRGRDDLLASGFTQTEFGTVGINESDPQYTLDVNGTTRIRQDLYVESDAGIGTKNPEYKLDVRGDVRATGVLYAESNVRLDSGARLVLPDGTIIRGRDDLMASAFTRAASEDKIGLYNDSPIYTWDIEGTLRASENAYFARRVGVQTESPEYALDVRGDIRTTRSLRVHSNIDVGGTLTLPDGTVLSGKNDLVSSSFTQGDSGAVGIGQSNPEYTLDVDGNVRASSNLYVQGDTGMGTLVPGHKLDVRGDVRATDKIYAENGVSMDGPLQLPDGTVINGRDDLISSGLTRTSQGFLGVNESSPQYTLDAGGTIRGQQDAYFASNVGVGTLDPAYRMDIRGDVRSTGQYIAEGGIRTDDKLILSDGTEIQGRDDLLASVFTHDSNYIGVLQSEPEYTLDVGGSVRASQDAYILEKLGIGTTSPACNLDVRGDVRVTGRLDTEASLRVGGELILSDGTRISEKDDLLSSVFTQTSADHLGLQNRDPEYTLDVGGSVCVRQEAYVLSNMGIGTQTPNYALDVQGNVRIADAVDVESNLSVGGALVLSDGHQISSRDDLLHSRFTEKNGKLGLNESEPFTSFDVNGTMRVQDDLEVEGDLTVTGSITGDGSSITNISLNNVTGGTLSVAAGGTGQTSLTEGRVLIGDGVNAVNHTANLYFDTRRERLSVGTDVAFYTLDVNGDARARGSFISENDVEVNGKLILSDGKEIQGQYDLSPSIITILNQNMGVEQTDPQYRLDVGGTLRSTGNAVFDNDVQIRGVLTSDGSGLTNLDADRVTRGVLGVPNGGTGRSSLQSGRLLIGNDAATIDDQVPLVVDKDNSRLGLWTREPAYTLDVSGDVRVVNDAYMNSNLYVDQRLGIQNSAPAYELDVSGRIRATSNISVEHNLLVSNRVGVRQSDPAYDVDITGDVRVTDNAYIENDLTVDRMTTLKQDVDIKGGLDVQSNVHVAGRIAVPVGSIAVNKSNADYTVDVDGDVHASRDLFVDGSSTLNGILRANSNAIVEGKLGVGGGDDMLIPAYDLDVRGDMRTTRNALVQNHMTIQGNVGVNRSNSEYALDVDGTARFAEDVRFQSSVGINRNDSNILYPLDVNGSVRISENAYLMSNVGIREFFPAYSLDVNGDTRIQNDTIVQGNIGVKTTDPSYDVDVNGKLRTQDLLVAESNVWVREKLGVNVELTDTSTHDFQVSGSARITDALYVDGKLGVNTQSASHNLEIEGDARMTGILNLESNAYIFGQVGIQRADPRFTLDVSGTTRITDILRTNSNLYVDRDCGIGTTDPSYPLHVVGSINTDSNLYIKNRCGINTTSPDYDLDVHGHVYAGSNLYVQENCGIGTTSPSYPLHVTGDIKTDSSLYIDSKCGINTTSPDYDLDVHGDVYTGSNLYVQENCGIGTTSPSYPLHVTGNIKTDSSLYIDSKCGINTTSPDYDLDVHGHVYAGSNLYVQENCGIGTTNPSHPLHVTGNIKTDSSLYISSKCGINTNSPDYDLDVHGHVYAGSNLYVQENCGIGTTNPSHPLHVTGDIKTDSSLYISSKCGINTNSPDYDLDVHGHVYAGSNLYVQENCGIGTTSPSYPLHVTGDIKSDSSLYINNNCGIGTTNPSYPLHVTGNIKTDSSLYISSKCGINTTSPDYDLDVHGHVYAGSNLYVQENCGIGTTSPSYPLHVTGNIKTDSSLYISSKCGINTTSPDYDLDVHGDAYVKNQLYVNDKLGVGRTDPSYNLDVDGDARTTSDLQVDGQVLLKNGSTSSPGLAFNGNTDTGMMLNSSTLSHVVDGTKLIELSSNKMMVNTKIEATGEIRSQGNVVAESDRRVKKNIRPLMHVDEKIKALQGLAFQRVRDDRDAIGFIAQDVRNVLPEVVTASAETEMLGIDYGKINALLVEGMKNMMQRMDVMETTIRDLKRAVYDPQK